jgi:hypothetical protein
MPIVHTAQNGEHDATVEVLHVYEVMDDDEDGNALIGSIEIHPDGHLAVIDAEAGREGFLRGVIDRLNSKPRICLISEAPGEASFTTRFDSIERGAKGFIEAELAYMQRYYGLVAF